MTREDIQGFVELLPVEDDSELWDLVADFLAKETVKRLGDLDPKLVLEVLCKLPQKNGDDAEDGNGDEPEDDEPEDGKDDAEGDDESDPGDENVEEPEPDPTPAPVIDNSGGYGSKGY